MTETGKYRNYRNTKFSVFSVGSSTDNRSVIENRVVLCKPKKCSLKKELRYFPNFETKIVVYCARRYSVVKNSFTLSSHHVLWLFLRRRDFTVPLLR